MSLKLLRCKYNGKFIYFPIYEFNYSDSSQSFDIPSLSSYAIWLDSFIENFPKYDGSSVSYFAPFSDGDNISVLGVQVNPRPNNNYILNIYVNHEYEIITRTLQVTYNKEYFDKRHFDATSGPVVELSNTSVITEYNTLIFWRALPLIPYIDNYNNKSTIAHAGNVSRFDYSYYEEPIYTQYMTFVDSLDLSPYYSNVFNPLEPGGVSGTGGGTGNFDNDSDPITIPNLPTLSATDTGLVKLYVPTLDELRLLSNFLWSDAWDISAQWKKLWGDPMQAILGLAIIPCVPEMSTVPVPCVVGNINTGVNMKYATSQYKEVDCGSLNINEYWGSALDYSPYTQIQIYLPYIGYKTLNVDEVMNRTLRVVYHIDVMSGSCVALIQSGGSVLYQFNGVCSTMIPVSGSDWTNLYRSVLSIVATGVNAMAGVGIATGALEAAGNASQLFSAEAQMRSAVISGGAQGVGTGTKALTHSKMTVEHGSSMSGSCGMLGTQTPYIIAIRPRQSMPQGYNQFVGFPCNMSLKLSDCRGYTTVETVHLEGIKATQSEIDEIESLLMGGVIL